jgi:hypothetical protein
MTDQPTPNITRADVERIAAREFPHAAAGALAILDEYGAEDWHREAERVRMAALKLARGDLERLRAAIATAKCDYRDVLAPAEYPEYCRSIDPSRAVSPEERQRVIDADSRQYMDWLAR